MIYIDPLASVSKKAKIGDGTRVWHQAQIRENAKIGKKCVIGKGVYIDKGVSVGDRVRIQNYASLYYYCNIENDVFIGPYVCLTNDPLPRASTVNGLPKKEKDWNPGKTIIKKGASLGAGVIVLPNVTIGKYAMIGAGAVVAEDVPSHVLVFGVPAKFRAYICKCGDILTLSRKKPRSLICENCKRL